MSEALWRVQRYTADELAAFFASAERERYFRTFLIRIPVARRFLVVMVLVVARISVETSMRDTDVTPLDLLPNTSGTGEVKKQAPSRSFQLSGRRDSNPRHLAWEASALPTELRPRG
jgi:hypothetical protein